MICWDLKLVELVLGLQGGHTKYPCFLCLWDNWADNQHYDRQEWLLRQGLKPGLQNIQSHPIIEQNKTLLPLSHIKLGVMKNFVKAMYREGSEFAFLQKFPQINIEKLKAGIFDSPQIKELMKDPMFDEAVGEDEQSTWQSLKSVDTNFRENHQSMEYEKETEELLKCFCQLRAGMSVKLHFLWLHLDNFQKNCRNLNEEQSQHFHQDIHIMEVRYQGWWEVNFLADYYWCLKLDVPEMTFHPWIASFV